jgi:hypothetical protein
MSGPLGLKKRSEKQAGVLQFGDILSANHLIAAARIPI